MFYDRLAQARKNKGISQQELADKLSVTQQTVAKWERDKATPDPERIKHISHILDCSLDYLLGNDTDVTQSDKLTNPLTGKTATKREAEQLEKVMQDAIIAFDGEIKKASHVDEVKKALEYAFWQIKEDNKKEREAKKKTPK